MQQLCPTCGAPHDPGAAFCANCGQRFDSAGPAAVAAPAPTGAPLARPAVDTGTTVTRPWWKRPWPWVGVGAALVLIIAIVVVLVARRNFEAARNHYTDDVVAALSPITPVNDTLSAALGALEPGDDPSLAWDAAVLAGNTTLDTWSQVDALTVPNGGWTLRADIETALDAQVTYLNAVTGTLSEPSDARIAALAAVADEVTEGWQAIEAAPGGGGLIAGTDELAAWAAAAGGSPDAAASSDRAGSSDLPTPEPAADLADYGSDAELDELADACERGDLGACDDLYDQSPVGSSYEAYGDSCGGRNAPSEYCREIYG